jgi:hypothetical protein
MAHVTVVPISLMGGVEELIYTAPRQRRRYTGR